MSLQHAMTSCFIGVFCFSNQISLLFCVVYQDAVSLARTEEEPEAAARKLTGTAFARGSADNITSIVVRFHHDKAESAGAHHD